MTRTSAPHSHAYDLLASTTNKISRMTSRVFNQQFGVGLLEWRILRLLCCEGELVANDISRILEADKAGVSRSVTFLEERGWISRSADVNDARRRLLDLTPSGASLQRRLAKVAQALSKDVFAGVSETDEAALVALLQRLSANATELMRSDGSRKHPSHAHGED